jgi:hypothetical protein
MAHRPLTERRTFGVCSSRGREATVMATGRPQA